MKVRLIFAWYDFWIGFYWSRKDRTLYVLPVPFFGLSIQFRRPMAVHAQPAQEEGNPPRRWKFWDDVRGNVIEMDGETYVGSGTVWHEYPSGKRCGARVESMLCELWEGHKMRRRGAP
jgi:hypothetical protein